MPEKRTPEQRKADIAAAAIERLTTMIRESNALIMQLGSLLGDVDELPEPVEVVIEAGWAYRDVREIVRDIASHLPIRGLDFGVTDA